MPDFGTLFSGLAHGQHLSHEELFRAVRFMVAAEYETVASYVVPLQRQDKD